MKKQPIIVERFADNGEPSHWELIDSQGNTIWIQPDIDFNCEECDFGEMKAIGYTTPNGTQNYECNICGAKSSFP